MSPSSPFRGWGLFFCGLCMGVADLIPGISGGTIAFILGFYQPLLESLKTLNFSTLRLFCQGKFKKGFQQVAWRFLAPLLAGIGCALITLASFFRFVLGHELYRVYLYATFFGLIIASILFCLRQVKTWSFPLIGGFCLGAIIAYSLTGSFFIPTSASAISLSTNGPFLLDGWIVICGALAICALLLPGISGSYLLTLLGVYPVVIGALADFVQALSQGSFDKGAFGILMSLLVGIVGGALVFARLLSRLLTFYPQATLAVLSGFMVGALPTVWPFRALPSWQEPLLWQACGCALFGFVAVFILEAYAGKRKSVTAVS